MHLNQLRVKGVQGDPHFVKAKFLQRRRKLNDVLYKLMQQAIMDVFPILFHQHSKPLTLVAGGVTLRLLLVIRFFLTLRLLRLLDGMHSSNRSSSSCCSSNRCRWLAWLSAHILVVKLSVLGGRLKLMQGRIEALGILLRLGNRG